jgi:hypothetical protein
MEKTITMPVAARHYPGGEAVSNVHGTVVQSAGSRWIRDVHHGVLRAVDGEEDLGSDAAYRQHAEAR